MPAKEFPWLHEVELEVRAKIDENRGEPGQPKWSRAEISHAFNAEHRYLYERISSMDRDFNLLVDDTITVAAGDETTALPDGIRVLRSAFELDGNGEVKRAVDVGAWHEMNGSCDREALYRPYPQAELFWLNKPSGPLTLRIVYGAHPPHLFHGCAQASGNLTLAVDSFEPRSDDEGIGRDILIYEGDGEGSVRTVSDYRGDDQEITVTASFSPLPTSRSRYTSRPDLPPDAKDAFVYGVCARLVEKFRDARFQEFTMQRMEKLNSAFTALNTLDRRGPLETYDVDCFGHGDPDWDFSF
jgi:hypothetical protein